MKYFNLYVYYKDEEAKKQGINNRPAEKYIDNILELNHDLVEPLRSAWGKYCKQECLCSPEWHIIAGYRCDELNKFYEGLKSSPHLKGFAVDFELENGQYAIFLNFAGQWLRENNIKFDEIVWKVDKKYIHLAIKNNEGKQRSHIKKE